MLSIGYQSTAHQLHLHQVTSQEEKLQSAQETVLRLDAASEADRIAIVEKEKAILDEERAVCRYSQTNLEEEHRNADLLKALVEVDSQLSDCEQEVNEQEKTVKSRRAELKRVTNTGKAIR